MSSFIYCSFVISILYFGELSAITDEMIEMTKMLHDSCVSETGVDESLIENCRSGKFSEDNKFKCYLKCLFDQMSAITDEGEIDVDVVVSILPEELLDAVESVIRGCGTVKGADACDSIFQTFKCYYNTKPESFFII